MLVTHCALAVLLRFEALLILHLKTRIAIVVLMTCRRSKDSTAAADYQHARLGHWLGPVHSV